MCDLGFQAFERSEIFGSASDQCSSSGGAGRMRVKSRDDVRVSVVRDREIRAKIQLAE